MMTRIVLAIAFAACSSAALAEELASAAQPRLKELVTVTSEIVRVGDLVENAGAAANIPIFRAPDLGQTGAVPVAKVAEALRPYDITGVDTGGLNEIVVTRLSRALTRKDITDRIARAVAGQYGLGDALNIGVILDRDIRVLHVEPTASDDLVVSRMNVDQRSGRFDFSFDLAGSAMVRRTGLRFTGTVSETVEAATMTRTLRAGEVIKASDVSIERRPKSEMRGESLAANQVVGMAAKAPLRTGQPVRADDVIRPQIIQRNEAVTVLYEVPGITVTVRGKALESGAVGDVIGVLNVQSNRTVQATVTGPGRVSIAAAGPLIASVTTPVNADQPTQ